MLNWWLPGCNLCVSRRIIYHIRPSGYKILFISNSIENKISTTHKKIKCLKIKLVLV